MGHPAKLVCSFAEGHGPTGPRADLPRTWPHVAQQEWTLTEWPLGRISPEGTSAANTAPTAQLENGPPSKAKSPPIGMLGLMSADRRTHAHHPVPGDRFYCDALVVPAVVACCAVVELSRISLSLLEEVDDSAMLPHF